VGRRDVRNHDAHYRAPDEYRFEAAEVQAFGPGKATLLVRLLDLQDKKPVNDAVIIEAKTDMGPSGMPGMSGTVVPAISEQSGLFRFG
jgi:hypothetical protein